MVINMKNYKYILFDLDDTLIDNFESYRYGYMKIIENLNIKYADKDFNNFYEFDKIFWTNYENNKITVPKEYTTSKELIAKYLRGLKLMLYFNISLEKAFEISEIFLANLGGRIIPIKGAYETLEYLHKKYNLVIASNGPSAAIKEKLEKINCYEFFKHIFSADMTRNVSSKPNKEFFIELLNHINYYDNSKILMVGDSLFNDVKGGMNSEIDTCWLNHNNEQLQAEYNPTMIINDLMTLTKKL